MSTGTQDVAFASIAEGRKLPVVIPCVYLRGNLHRVSVLPDSRQDYAGLQRHEGRRADTGLWRHRLSQIRAAPRRHQRRNDINLVAVGDGQAAAAALTSSGSTR